MRKCGEKVIKECCWLKKIQDRVI